MKTLITGGKIVTPDETVAADVLIDDGVIVALGKNFPENGAQVYDATGKYILPGGVDVHTHITLNAEAAQGTDTYFEGTSGALAGGTTAIVDHMAFMAKGCTFRQHLEDYHRLADGKAAIDYGFHGVSTHVDEAFLKDLEDYFAQGLTSFKIYMTYDGRVADDEIYRLFQKTRELGMLVAVHCENHDLIGTLRDEYKKEGHLEPVWHPRSRPAHAEAEAISRLLHIAALADDAPVYVVHLSTALGLEEIRKARRLGQKNIFVETCTQYLTLTDQVYNDPVKGLEYIMAPPLRKKADIEALWQGLANGEIQNVATDHCSFSIKDKMRGLGNFMACPSGAPGIEERIAVMYSEGVAKKRISVNKLVEVISANPAKLFGIAPKKGTLVPGADADIVILDPHAKHVLTAEKLHGPSDYSPYEGFTLQGKIETVFAKGEIALQNEIFTSKHGAGQFLRRSKGQFWDVSR